MFTGQPWHPGHPFTEQAKIHGKSIFNTSYIMAILTASQIAMTLKSQGYKLHHKALSRGYVCKGYSHALEYSGRFGTGYVLHVANSEFSVSNNYHHILYFIKEA